MYYSINRLSIVSLLLFVLICGISFADNDKPKNKLELRQKYGHLRTDPAGPTDDPPPQPAQAVAEWEPATGVLICYPLAIPLELVAAMSEVVEVVTFIEDDVFMTAAINDYLRAGIDTSNCMFVFTGDENLPYTRDFGPWYIFTGDDEQGFINNEYPWWSVNDEDIPLILGDTLEIPVYSTGLYLEGGNYMTDGMGTSITTDAIYWENEPLSPAEIEGVFAEYLGISNTITVPDPFWNIVPHIDCHAKFLDPGRILVIEVDPPNTIIEENVEYWQTLMSGYGRPYEILRVPGLGYANSLFLNDNVFVALSGDPIGDSTAVATFLAALPGYSVEGFYYPSFMFLDALHCRTHEAADRYMLRIVHVPVHDLENTGGDYNLEANIRPYSNEPLVGSPYIVWNVNGGAYNYTPMTYNSGYDYEGSIPQQPDGSDIFYYLEAEDATGRVENHPYIGSGNPHRFYVGPDTEPPIVEFDLPEEVLALEWPMEVTVYALDNRWISEVTIESMINGVPQPIVNLPLEEPYAVYYTGMTVGDVQPGDVIEMQVKVVDNSVNMNTVYWPETGYHLINVTAPPEVSISLTPTGLPIQIPANGGSFDFNVAGTNSTGNPETFDIWTMITLPDGSEYGPVINVSDFTLSAGTAIDRDRTQTVPAGAPAGLYTYDGYIGGFPDIVWSEDHFEFEKLEDADGGLMVSGWGNYGESFEEIFTTSESSIPSEFALHPAYPNPFNPVTTLNYYLPKSSDVSLVIYDVTGREVSRLADSFHPAGNYKIDWDAAGFASGIYFARLDDGKMQMTQKLLLIK